jgi:hypothetical protein
LACNRHSLESNKNRRPTEVASVLNIAADNFAFRLAFFGFGFLLVMFFKVIDVLVVSTPDGL